MLSLVAIWRQFLECQILKPQASRAAVKPHDPNHDSKHCTNKAEATSCKTLLIIAYLIRFESNISAALQSATLTEQNVSSQAKSRLPSLSSIFEMSARGSLWSKAWLARSLRLILVISYLVPPIFGPWLLL